MNLKKKARIIVPESCLLIGVIDADGILEEDEVYISLKKDPKYEDEFSAGAGAQFGYYNSELEGEVLATRCPITYPGDIRILKARSGIKEF